MDYLTVANHPIFWVLCAVTVALALGQALLYMRQAKKMSAKLQLDPAIPNQAFRIGLISAIGPACGVFIVMVGLMASIGGPVAWMRLSIIGSASAELTASSLGATAYGVQLGGEGYNLTALALSWIACGLNGAGWLVVSGLFAPVLGTARDKISGGDSKWLGVLSLACTLGLFGYLNATDMKKGLGFTCAVLGGALSMIFIQKFIVPKCPKLAEFALGIAMIIGMICAVIYDAIAV